jgi:Predicted membrane protein
MSEERSFSSPGRAAERTRLRETGRRRGPVRLDQPRETRLRLPRYDPEAFGRWSEGIARFMGTARFLVYMTVVIVLWIGWNTLAPPGWRFDPYTFTFLTLMLSIQASYAAPLILLAQNRQADRDRLALEEDRRRAAMQKADTEYLTREIAALRIALGDVATRDFLRGELNRLGEQIAETVESASAPPSPPRPPKGKPPRRTGQGRPGRRNEQGRA